MDRVREEGSGMGRLDGGLGGKISFLFFYFFL